MCWPCGEPNFAFGLVGAPLYGELELAGVGPPKVCAPIGCAESLKDDCLRSNHRLVPGLKTDKFAAELFELTCADAALGRMSYPVSVADFELDAVRAHPRFSVDQGVKQDGKRKIRAVDNLSWCAIEGGHHRMSKKRLREGSINGHCAAHESVKHDHVDDLASAMAEFIKWMKQLPSLWKADIDSAFRRIPLLPDHRWASAIAFLHLGQVIMSTHAACPFGATSSVHAWERIGALLCTLARRVLNLAVYRYVDDFFGLEREETVEHAMQCFARLVRVLMGATAIADRKLECGRTLCVLGVDLSLSVKGYTCRPSKDKAGKCIAAIKEALACGHLSSGCAEKLAGRLSWACQYLFHRLGRAMLRPIFKHKFSRFGKVDCTEGLRVALTWWGWVLTQDIVEERSWCAPEGDCVYLFVDARGVPPRCAAVLYVDGFWHYTDGVPAKKIMACLQPRKDNQIMSLETMVISIGLATFAEELRGRKVLVFSDNTGAEAAAKRGSAHAWDHCEMVHGIWTQAFLNQTHVWIVRVPSDDNLSDLPSREKYELVHELGAVWRPPLIGTDCKTFH